MYSHLPQIPPYPRTHQQSSTPGSGPSNDAHNFVPAPYTRANTAPDGFRAPGRPNTSQGLPSSLMPGAGSGRSRQSPTDALRKPHDVDSLNAHDKALFFQAPTPPPRPLANRRSYDFYDKRTTSQAAPPPVPPLPPQYPYPSFPPASAPARVEGQGVPKLPPKIPVSRSRSAQAATVPPPSSAPNPVGRFGHSRNESVSQEDIERAVAMSLAESSRSNLGSVQEREDLELERALQESLTMSSPGVQPNPVDRGPQQHLFLNTSTASMSSEASRSSRSINSSPTAMFRSLTSSGSQSPTKERHSATMANTNAVESMLAAIAAQNDEERKLRQMEEDERLARMLAAQEPPKSIAPQASRTASSSPSVDHPALPALPRYEDAVRESARPRAPSPARSTASRGSSSFSASGDGDHHLASPKPNGNPMSNTRVAHGLGAVGMSGRSVSAHPIPSSPELANISQSRPGPSPSANGARANSAPAQAARIPPPQTRLETVVEQGLLPNASLTTQQNAFIPPIDSFVAPFTPTESDESVSTGQRRPSVSSQGSSGPRTPPPSAGIVVPIEDELLMGVSFGFNAPSIVTGRPLMQCPLPNIIALPYGKCPPLHIQAPTWKQLLILLTRMSESRIEPQVEAVAANKSDLKLRTVVQFVKVHPSSTDWRVVLYLTIDMPVAPTAPNPHKYTNGDVSTLPFSYTLTPLPTLLRDSADAALAKYYTVPQSANLPFPTLPIQFPSFAMYLHAALSESRRAMGDSSGGMRRLAKMVDSFYPLAEPSSAEGVMGGPEMMMGPDRIRVGGLFKRAFARNQKNSTTNSARGGNADTYEFITPFRMDEWG